jgi:anti-sigma regulatory factor (Ser/Thr protein kinase)
VNFASLVERALELDAVLASVRTVSLWLNDAARAARLPYDVAFGLDVAVHEAVENVVRYAWSDAAPHRFVIRFRSDGGSAEVEISDDGRPFDPLSVAAPANAPRLEEAVIGGRGIQLIRYFTSEVRYRREQRWNRLTLVRRYGASDGT